MKIRFLCIFILLFVAGCSIKQEKKEKHYKVMTYNIRYDNPDDGEDNWHKRKKELVGQIKKHAPDILGTQEVLAHQLGYLDSMLTNYHYVGVGREDGKTKGEYVALFYDKTKWKCLKRDTFWLSETPDTVSIGWDAALERICTYALLENNNTKQKVWAMNVHFDHMGGKARENSAKLLLTKIEQLRKEIETSVILMGDFNLVPEEQPIHILGEKLENSHKKDCKQGTFNNFLFAETAKNKIDYIFTKDIIVNDCEILTEKRQNGRCISDHFPILVSFTIK